MTIPASPVFPLTAAWVASCSDIAAQQAFTEYVWSVGFHLKRAQSAAQACRTVLDRFEHRWTQGGRAVVFTFANPVDIAAHEGSTAICESVAAFDATLPLINHLLRLGVPPRQLNWGRRHRTEPSAVRWHATRVLPALNAS
jgi:hypothetical protein